MTILLGACGSPNDSEPQPAGEQAPVNPTSNPTSNPDAEPGPDVPANSAPNPDIRPAGKGFWTHSKHDERTAATIVGGDNLPILYHGGPVKLGTINAYFIWYGNWPEGNPVGPVLTNFMSNYGGSALFNTVTTYYEVSDGADVHMSNSIHFAGSTTDAYSQGSSVSDAQIQTIVATAIQNGRLPLDPNGVYFVLTSADVSQAGFCTEYCGWHTYGTILNTTITYAFIGDTARCPSECQAQPLGPNDTTKVTNGADGMANVMGHEMIESGNDPTLMAWYDRDGYESADKCAWTFGAVHETANHTYANMELGGRNYLIQQNWVYDPGFNSFHGFCGLSVTPP